MVDIYVLNKVIGRIIKMIWIGEFDNTKIVNDTDDIWPDDITLKNAVVLMTSAIIDGKFYL